ncbi:MAG: glycine cleavage T C-terminal barrel domain-containing protein, partial [Pseudomonadota bacterium]
PAHREADGEAAADEALAHLGLGPAEPRARPARSGAAESHPWPVFPHPRGRDFIDFDEDVQVKDLKGAVAQGFDNIELMKRFTTVGMGPSQGKHSNMTAVRLLARERDQAIDATGTTTARPLFHPVPMGMLAGTRRRPQRRSPVHGRHEAAGAHLMPSGAWQRPAWYGPDPATAVAAEYRAVREAAGLMDVSTLGKLEVFGPDAATLLERFCINGFARLKVGRSRYAVMVDEAGVIRDDGVAARLGREHFYLTTTTGGADASYRELLRTAIERGLDATVINRTGQVAALNLAGPQATTVLAGVTAEAGSIEALPAGGVGTFDIGGVRARVLRTAFTGREAFEIHLPADRARHLWDSLTALGAAHGLRPFGVEAQRLLRLEMGHLILGQDTDATATPLEAGLEGLIRWDKGDFIGRRSLEILARRGPKERLTGLRLDPGQQSAGLEPGCLVLEGEAIAGRLTSIGESPSFGIIGLASVSAERATPGQPLILKAVDGRRCRATTCATPFTSPEETA